MSTREKLTPGHYKERQNLRKLRCPKLVYLDSLNWCCRAVFGAENYSCSCLGITTKVFKVIQNTRKQ